MHDLRITYEFFQEHGALPRPGEMEEMGRVLGRAPRRFEQYAAELAREWRG